MYTSHVFQKITRANDSQKSYLYKDQTITQTIMDAMNNMVINVPIEDDNISKRISSLPRTEKNSGIVSIRI